ncbi:hypothetical protein KUCAC02_000053 [Chaenocephalus aceratus]|nr:hypothetical protein KUCAC02_000053 [Chaenocephalus aceratus]
MGGAVVDDAPPGVKAPDGGWGWAVLAGGFVITGFSYAFPKAVSVFFKELILEFDVGYSDTALISSILLAMLYGSGPLCSVLVNRFGCRPVMMVGGLFASLGMILASFATSIIHIYLCTGVITGLGLALNFQPSLIMLNRYFSEKRPLANGLAAAGSPVALCCLSPLGQVLQYHYGWRGGFLILGGLLLNCCACGALMRPLLPPKKAENLEESIPTEEKKIQPKKKLLDFSVFKDRGFIIYTLAASIMVLGLFVPPVFVPARSGSDPETVYVLSFAMIFNGCTDLIGSQAKDYGGLVIFCIFFGISYGMVGALQFEVLMAVVGTEKFPSAIGLVLLVEAIAVLVGPPGAGRLLDYTNVYMYVFLLAGCEVTLSAMVLALGNLFCIKIKHGEAEATLEMAVNAAEKEGLNRGVEEEEDYGGEEEPKGKDNGKVRALKAGEEEKEEENTSI